jgi:hypothetical protein
VEADEHRIPFSEPFGQITPRRSGTGEPQHRFQKAPIVCAGATGIAHFAGQQRRDPLPLLITQDATIQGEPLLSGLALETA